MMEMLKETAMSMMIEVLSTAEGEIAHEEQNEIDEMIDL